MPPYGNHDTTENTLREHNSVVIIIMPIKPWDVPKSFRTKKKYNVANKSNCTL